MPKKMFAFISLAFLSAAIGRSAFASATDSSSVLNSAQNSAWFLGSSRTVHYCVLRDPAFSKSQTEIEDALSWSVRQWQNYISEAHVQDRPALLQLATQFERVQNCEGVDLKLYFGVESAEIDTYKAEDFIHPVAFTKRLSYDAEAGWSHGLVWVSDDTAFAGQTFWQKQGNFKAVLLHEMGHVFGVTHLAGTIMQETILDAILKSTPESTYTLTHIENEWELASPMKAAWATGAHFNELGTMSEAAFSKLIGRAPQGTVQGRWLPEQKQIRIRDDLGEYALDLSVIFERTNKTVQEPLFHAYRSDSEGHVRTANGSHEASIRIGQLRNLAGQVLNVVIEKNVGFRQLQIRFQAVEGAAYGELFRQPCEMRPVPLHRDVCFPIYPNEEG